MGLTRRDENERARIVLKDKSPIIGNALHYARRQRRAINGNDLDPRAKHGHARTERIDAAGEAIALPHVVITLERRNQRITHADKQIALRIV